MKKYNKNLLGKLEHDYCLNLDLEGLLGLGGFSFPQNPLIVPNPGSDNNPYPCSLSHFPKLFFIINIYIQTCYGFLRFKT